MAKRKKQPEVIKPVQPGVPLELNHPEIPDSWMPIDDFSSHRPMLYRTIMNTHHNGFFEFGTGKGSTPLLRELYNKRFLQSDFISYESDYQWFQIIQQGIGYKEYDEHISTYGNHSLYYEPDYMHVNVWRGSIVFIDCAPGELRKYLISKHSNIAKLIIVHDSEPGADYVYGMKDILNSFKYRCDLIVEGAPSTTVVSNLYDFNNWKTLINDKIRFE